MNLVVLLISFFVLPPIRDRFVMCCLRQRRKGRLGDCGWLPLARGGLYFYDALRSATAISF